MDEQNYSSRIQLYKVMKEQTSKDQKDMSLLTLGSNKQVIPEVTFLLSN